MSNYHKLYTPQDSAVVFIDQQPQMAREQKLSPGALVAKLLHAQHGT